MRWRISRPGYWVSGLMVVILAGVAAVIWKASTELMSPARRTLQAYHLDWLERPFEHGMRIQRFAALEGQVPCLLVLPDPAAGLSKRGETVRRQLLEKGVAVEPFGTTIGNLVLLHGRNGRKEDLLPVAERFCAVGFRCVIPDLPAHGESPLKVVRFGTSKFESELPGMVLEETVAKFRLPEQKAGLWAMSMGGAFLAKAAALPEAPWRALVVVCSFDSLDEVVERKMASYTGFRVPFLSTVIGRLCVARGGIDPSTVQPAKWAAAVAAPVFITHGEKDSLISLSQGRQLFEAYGSREKKWTEVKGGDHERILVTEYPLYAEMAAWYLKYLGQ